MATSENHNNNWRDSQDQRFPSDPEAANDDWTRDQINTRPYMSSADSPANLSTERETESETWQSEPEAEESFFDNSYGSGSDSSRNILFEGNEMIFENDPEGRAQDRDYQQARRENEDWERRRH